jgi:hypothetical protein
VYSGRSLIDGITRHIYSLSGGVAAYLRNLYGIRGLAYGHIHLQYHVKVFFGVPIRFGYDIKNVVADAARFLYNSLINIGDVTRLVYEVGGLVAGISRHTYNVLEHFGEALRTRYNILTLSSAVQRLRYNMKQLVSPTGTHIFDDCENLYNEEVGATWWTFGPPPLTLTTNSKYGTYAINSPYDQGGPGGFHAQLDFGSSQDWSDKLSFELWLVPRDNTATWQNTEIIIYDSGGNWHKFFIQLSTLNVWELKKCEINGSGYGDAPNQTSGTMDWTSVDSIRIQQSVIATPTIDIDQLVLRQDRFEFTYSMRELVSGTGKHRYTIRNLISNAGRHGYNILGLASGKVRMAWSMIGLIGKVSRHVYSGRELITRSIRHIYGIVHDVWRTGDMNAGEDDRTYIKIEEDGNDWIIMGEEYW